MSLHPFPAQLPTLQHLGVDDPTGISPIEVASAWFDAFSNAINSSDVAAILDSFLDDGFWKDVLALTWDFRTLHGRDAIKNLLDHRLGPTGLSDLRLCRDHLREPELQKMFPDLVMLRLCFEFGTKVGKGVAVCYLAPVPGSRWKAYTLFTCLESLNYFPEQIGEVRARGGDRGTWEKKRHQEQEFLNEEPTAVIVGAGHTGLEIAARLKYLGVPCLVVDKKPRVGDNWRDRYKALCLHDSVWYDQTPYMQFPPTWPVNCPAGKLADWLESYAKHLELNVWTSSNITKTVWDDEAKVWTVGISREGDIRVLQTKHLVFATGIGGHPKIPDIPGKSNYRGEVLHSSQFTSAESYVGKKAVVVGACTSGHDIAHDFLTHGVDVTMYQRSPIYVLSTAAASAILGAYYREGFPTELADIYGGALPNAVVTLLHQRLVPHVAQTLDKTLLESLAKAGFETNLGPDGAGIMPLFFGRAGGYYLNTGTSEHVINGDIKIKNRTSIECYTDKGLKFSDGTELEADIIVFSTGYSDPRDSIRDVCGSEIADKVSPVWGLDEEEQIRGAWRYCGHEGLWRGIGNLAMSRFHSLHLAFQIKAIEAGLLKRSEIVF
ncbi:hypothetical protein F5I97DRAFT_1803036 [Phlebopus sp. FC_14]|nr:hypothetical protein F5I97DRAFT_1803036 [Phlebopus sp. FC_14]